MMLKQKNLAVIVAFAMSGIDTARAQDPIITLRQLVEISARRLALAEQVALAKWDNHTPVEDPSREAKVIESAVKQGQSAGLDGTFVSNFFRAQIEANKTAQYYLLADWYRAGKTPAHAPINSVGSVRLEPDRLQTALIAALADSANIRATGCLPVPRPVFPNPHY
jgi:chorismate mutase